MTDHTLRRAQQAKEVLENQLFNDAFDHLDSLYLRGWRNSTTPELREKFFQKVSCLTDVRAEMIKHIAAAAKEEIQIDQEPSGFWNKLYKKIAR